MVEQRNRLAPGEVKLVRRVAKLHPTVEVNLTPSDIDYYRRIAAEFGGYAMVLDRQSQKRILTDEEKVGQQNRVRHVKEMALKAGLYLPSPAEKPDRKEGEFQFDFDTGGCRYHWFVDGQMANATGYSASPYARRQLWRCAKTARLLADLGCPPRKILIGELTRFFRDQRQFLDWYHILKQSSAEVSIYGCADITPETEGTLLPMYLCQVEALSAWLRKQSRDSRISFREQGKLFSLRAPFGLEFDLDSRKDVYPHPIEWPILQEMVARIVSNSFPVPDGEPKAGWGKRPLTQARVLEWLTAECALQNVDPARIPRSRGWLSELLKGDLLLASYKQYGKHFLRCKLEDDEMDTDWDLTPNGYFRYVEVEKPDEAVYFSVKLEPDQEIPTDDVLRARALLSVRGRPARDRTDPRPATDPYQPVLLRGGMIRCAKCGWPVIEKGPQIKPDRRREVWRRSQDERLVEMIARRMNSTAMAAELTRWSEVDTGRHFVFDRDRVRKRKSALKFHSTYEENRARLAAYWDNPHANKRQDHWHLYCECVWRLARKYGKTPERVATWEVAQHTRSRVGSISLDLEPRLYQALFEDPRFDPSAQRRVPRKPNRHKLETELAEIDTQIERVQEGWLKGIFTDESARTTTERLRGERLAKLAEIAALGRDLLAENDRADFASREQMIVEMRALVASPAYQERLDWRKLFVCAFVKEVIVDLDTGAYTAKTRSTSEACQTIWGHVLTAEAGPACPFHSIIAAQPRTGTRR